MRLALALALAALSLAALARAQVYDQRKPGGHADPSLRPSVTSWAPQAGRVGTQVTIEGTGFTRDTTVLVGGRPVRAVVGRTRIRFSLPSSFGDGEIRLRALGVANDVVVGHFAVELPTEIRAVAPGSGPAGSKVEISGTGFAGGDEVRMNGRALPIAESSPDRMVVTIPEWARTDFLLVTRAGVDKARSRRPFRVLAAPPLIAGFSPPSGPPGTVVRLSGTNFGPDDAIRYGARVLPAIGRGNGWVDVRVPTSATTDAAFKVTGAGGVALSPTAFRLETPPVIASVRPLFGVPGSQLTIIGRGFQPGDKVFLGTKRADIAALRPGEIVALVPHGTPGGAIGVRRGEVEAIARQRFEVVMPPTLTGFLPTRGEGGARVTLTGTSLAGAAVWYGVTRLRPHRADDKSIEVTVPRGLSDRRFRVVTRGGEATSDRAFETVRYGLVRDVKPRRVSAGGSLTLIGEGLDHLDKVWLGGVEASIALRQPRTATVVVPPGATSGPLAWLSHGRRETSSFPIEVLQPPTIDDFQPDAAPPRSKLIVRGRGLDRGTRVFFGDRPLTPIARVPGALTVLIPADAVGRDYLWVENEGARVRSATELQILVAATIRDVVPRRIAPGATVSVRGIGFDASTDILVGPYRTTVRARKEGELTVELPIDAAPGVYDVTAKNGSLTSTFRAKVVVAAPPSGLPPPPRAY